MKPYSIRRFLLGFCCCIFIHLSAQTNSDFSNLSSLAKKFIKFSKSYPQENVYIHFDNTEYYQGETIWFKAYVVRTDRNSLSDMSKILYVELLSPEGSVIDTKKLKIENGLCHGDFELNTINRAGFYEVRAYTRYMLNFGENNYFSRVFAIYDKVAAPGIFKQKISPVPRNLQIPQVRPVVSQKEKLNVIFYPEGGNLVQGITSQVAFKAIGNNGENIVISGNLFNQKNEKIADISSEFDGMGQFSFLPDSGKYYIKIPFNDKEYTFQLPQISPTGYTLSVNNSKNETVDILIQKNEKTKNDSIGLTITCRGVLYGFEKIGWSNDNIAYFSFLKKLLPSGVSQITLYNSKGEILSQRMMFVNHHSEMKMTVTQNKPAYNPFEKIGLVFDLKDKNDKPIETEFSVAVRDVGASTINPYADNSLTNLLLSSELKGYIENPAYYFEKNDRAHLYALDLLMLTQGWSKYEWRQMTGSIPFKVNHPMEKGLYIEGTVRSLVKKVPKPNVNVLMFLTNDTTSQHGSAVTDSLGKFYFSVADFTGKQKLSIQTKEKEKRKDNNVMLDRVFSPILKSYTYEEQQIPKNIALKNRLEALISKNDSLETSAIMDSLMKQDNNGEKTRMLDEVTVKENRKQNQEAEGQRNVSIVYDVQKSVDDLIDSNKDEPYDVLDFLEKTNPYFSYEIITSINPENANDTYKVKATYKGKNAIFCINNTSLFVGLDTADKKPMSNYDELTSYNLTDLTSLSINEQEGNALRYDTTNSGNFRGNEVVIYVYTDKYKKYNAEIKGIRQTKFQGYSAVKEFYSIPYDIFNPDDKDHRRTLYWNPSVKTDVNGTATVRFFNSSSCKIMNINAETVTQNGIIGTLNK